MFGMIPNDTRRALVSERGRLEQRGFRRESEPANFATWRLLSLEDGYAWQSILLFSHFCIFGVFHKRGKTSYVYNNPPDLFATHVLGHILLLASASVDIRIKNWNSVLKLFTVVGRVFHTILVPGIQQVLNVCLLYWNNFCSSHNSLSCPSDRGLPKLPELPHSTQHSSDRTRNIQLTAT